MGPELKSIDNSLINNNYNETNNNNYIKKSIISSSSTTTTTMTQQQEHTKSNSDDNFINELMQSGGDDDNNDIIKFQSNINNTLEQLLKTMKQTELSRIYLNLARQQQKPAAMGSSSNSGSEQQKHEQQQQHQWALQPTINSNDCHRRNSVNSPSLTVFNHMQHNNNNAFNNYYDMDNSNRSMNMNMIMNNPPSALFQASRRGSIANSSNKPKVSRRVSLEKPKVGRRTSLENPNSVGRRGSLEKPSVKYRSI